MCRWRKWAPGARERWLRRAARLVDTTMASRVRDLPFFDRVLAMRTCLTSLENPASISDDSDMWSMSMFGTSPAERLMERNGQRVHDADVIAKELVRIGPTAAEAVAAGLRLQGWWRDPLLPYARKHRTVPCIHDALVLVAVRLRDPLAVQAARILDGKQLLTADQLADRRRRRRRRR